MIFASSVSAITVEEIARLSVLKTSDDIILQLVRQNPPEKPLSPAQIIYLRENGVSETIVSALLQDASQGHPEILPKQDGESHWIDGSARYYYTTTADGQKKMVVTNLDENGRPMGPPPPPRLEPVEQIEPPPRAYQTPQEVHVVVEMQRDNQFERSYDDNYGPLPGYSGAAMPYDYSYAPPYGFIPDYPGSSFGFHLFPQFTVVHPGMGFGHHSFSRHFPQQHFHPHPRYR